MFPHIEIIHSKESPIRNPVIVKVESNGLRLHFDGSDQSLRLIEVLDWSLSTRVAYKGTELAKDGVLTFKQIYSKVFGPTYPGWFDRDSSRYILSYPGVAFSFVVPESISEDSIVKYLSGATPNNSRDLRGACLSMAIFKGHSWQVAQSQIFKPRPLLLGKSILGNGENGSFDNEPEVAPNSLSESSASQIMIDHLQIRHTSGDCLVIFSHHPHGIKDFDIKLNSTDMQSAIMTLGPPSERIFKQDSRLSIHNPDISFDEDDIVGTTGTNNRRRVLSELSSRANTDLFFNYFELGFDLCFDTSLPNPTVKKIIIHGNVPSSLSFQVYNRCRWLLFPPSNRNGNSSQGSPLPPVSSETPFTEFYNQFVPEGTNTPPMSMMLNRTIESPGSSVELVGEDDINHSAADEDDWGATQLYGCPRCIFEVLKNGAVSSLTIF
ncbi:hypothetical protein AWJ20_3623 [Sugiyamaella lignohabitans]|uniref:Uncharacterized protein n=1 Tax=Sugiyamaella lignohabitans TaxID=796027 RepID=A0A170QYD8_9ASCO|nr:uncharacterized protein AWJ20_3623 [Sugiyamaella lignohabitans]ANB15974.1 hypothetical protein AWJ20_3623 [Sugiyamaella lignohabitans]